MTIKEIDQLIEQGNSLKLISQAYSEIANQKIKRIRYEAERNRVFFQEISYVYGLIRTLAQKKGIAISKPKKRVCLIMTSNFRFYGNINSELIDFFDAQTKNLDTDRILIGRAAVSFFGGKSIKNQTQVILKTDQPDINELNYLTSLIKDYNQVLIFYSKLKTLLYQEPAFSDLTASSKIDTGSENLQIKFIFEPDIVKILSFFDSQILNLLLEEVFLESEVSRTASRFISMDAAENQANKFIKEYQKMRSYAQRNIKNNQILESMAAIYALKGTR